MIFRCQRQMKLVKNWLHFRKSLSHCKHFIFIFVNSIVWRLRSSRCFRWIHCIAICCFVSHHFFRHFSQFVDTFQICRVFYGFIIGSKGTTISCIRSETDTEIKIPRGKNDKIEIRGKNRENVRSAGKQIEAIVSSSRDKLSVNHFTNVRIIDVGINGNYEQFMVCYQ